MNTNGEAQPVGFCCLTESGRVEYCDGKPMFMAGPVGNYLHSVALYPHPDPVRDALVEALTKLQEACDDSDSFNYGTLSTSFVRDICTDALKAAGVVLP